MEVRPYTVSIPPVVLDDLHERLARTRWPDEIAATGWEYGADLRYMTDLVEYWRNRFDWRAHERAINAFAHFRATVDGVGIHVVHEKGRGPAPIPIIITHGWPGLREVLEHQGPAGPEHEEESVERDGRHAGQHESDRPEVQCCQGGRSK